MIYSSNSLVITTISIILCFNKTPANPGSPGKWVLKWRQRKVNMSWMYTPHTHNFQLRILVKVGYTTGCNLLNCVTDSWLLEIMRIMMSKLL